MDFCRQHPWFQVDLPPYLRHPPEVVENETFKIEEEIIEKCLALKIPNQPTLTREQLIELLVRHDNNHPLRVAYDLMLDQKNAKIRVDGMFKNVLL